MSNMRVFLEPQVPEPELELSLSQLLDQPLQVPQPPHSRPRDEARPSKQKKQPHFSFGMEIFKKTLELW
jgi:hypothetical protein